MAKFHNYSFNNTMLIAMQRPDAPLVTSYKNWQSMGRQVMKGEKGITIIAPAPELLTAAVQDFDSFMQAIQKISPVPIR